MLAFIKNNKLIINCQVHESEKEELNTFISNLDIEPLNYNKLYDINGDISGIEFYTSQE